MSKLQKKIVSFLIKWIYSGSGIKLADTVSSINEQEKAEMAHQLEEWRQRMAERG